MCTNSVSLPGPREEATPDLSGKGRGRRGVAGWAIVFASLMLAWPGLPTRARAQVPGPESFAQEPRTPAELWAAVDYLLRTGQTGKAIPYLDKFMSSNPDDATLIEIRDRYGTGSILRLADDPATREVRGAPGRQAGGGRAAVRDPARAGRPVRDGPDRDARGAGSRRRPSQGGGPLRRALPGRGARSARDLSPKSDPLLARNLGRLDRSTVPALLAVLDSPDPRARGRRGDGPRANRRRPCRPLPDLPGGARPSRPPRFARPPRRRSAG